ncbi:MAG: STAS domain-containing protein [Ruminococcaceae bacterium]|nr:STAS domain-containing protein [Oscillospiraceae bacterium]
MSVKIVVNGEVLTAFLDGEIDHHSASVMRSEIDSAVEKNMPTMLILDFRDVTFMDSSGIGLVMGRYKVLKPIGGELHITNASPHIHKVMKLAGLDRLAKMDR